MSGFGPQVVGGRYHNGYWHTSYTVTAKDRDTITVVDDDGKVRTHRTPWDAKDRQVGETCDRLSCRWGRGL